MRMSSRSAGPQGWIGALVLAGTTVVLAGCTGSPPPQPVQTTVEGASMSALLPPKVRDAGKIVVGVTATYVPYEYMDSDGKTIVGANVDVLEALAELFGVTLEWQNAQAYGSLLPGVDAGRYDAAIIFDDTPERQKVVDLVDFYRAGLVFLGEAGDTSDPGVVCGKDIGVGTGNDADLESGDLNKELCTDTGLPAMRFHNFANTDGQFTALTSGRIDFVLTGDAVASSFVATNEEYSVRSGVYAASLSGIALPKDGALTEAFQIGLQKLADDGQLRAIFKKWNLEHQVIDKIVVNSDGSEQ